MASADQQHRMGTVVQSWVPRELAAELKRRAEAERRSVSSVIRIAVEERLREKGGAR